MNKLNHQFVIKVSLLNKTPFTHVVSDKLTIGRDPRSDIILTDKNAPEKLLEINQKNGSLYLKYLGPKRYGFLNNLSLEEDQNYFLSVNDKIKAKNNVFEIIEKNENDNHDYSNSSQHLVKELGLILEDDNVPVTEKKTVSIEKKDLKYYVKPERTREIKKVDLSDKYTSPQYKEAISKEKLHSRKNLVNYVDPKKLLSLKIYALIVDFFLCYMFVGILLPKILPYAFFNEISSYLITLIGLDPNSSFLSFVIFLYLINFIFCIIFGSTFGQFFVGLKMNTNNKFSRMILLRLKTFLYSLFLIPAQNAIRNSTFFTFSRYVLAPVLIVASLAMPFILSPFSFSSQGHEVIVDETMASSKHIVNYQNANQTHQLLLQRSSKTITHTTIKNRFYTLMKFGQNLKDLNSLLFIDMIEDQNLEVSLVQTITYENLNTILGHGNPFFYKNNDPLKLKTDFLYALTFSFNTYLKDLLSHGIFTGNAFELKRLFLPKTTSQTLTIKNYSLPDSLVVIDTDDSRFYYIFDEHELFILKASTKNQIALTNFEEQIFGNTTKDNVFTPPDSSEEGPKELTLLQLFKVNSSQHPSQVLTYYINAVNKLENSEVIFNQEKLNLDLRYLLVKAIEQTAENTQEYKNKRDLLTIIHKLTPMEMPGEQDE